MHAVLAQTPPWVWGILVLLAGLGYLQTKRRLVSGRTIAVLPLAMTGLSAYSVWAAFGCTVTSAASWLCGVVLSQAINGVWQHPRNAIYLKDTDKFQVQGSLLPFGLMMGIFFTKYFMGAAVATRFLSPANTPFVAVCSALLGVFSGMFIARARKIAQSARQ